MPYKGISIYTRAGMDLRNSSEYLGENLGDLIVNQPVVRIAGCLNTVTNTNDKLFYNYIQVLQLLQENILCFSRQNKYLPKIVICFRLRMERRYPSGTSS